MEVYCRRVTTLFWKTIIIVRAINSCLRHSCEEDRPRWFYYYIQFFFSCIPYIPIYEATRCTYEYIPPAIVILYMPHNIYIYVCFHVVRYSVWPAAGLPNWNLPFAVRRAAAAAAKFLGSRCELSPRECWSFARVFAAVWGVAETQFGRKTRRPFPSSGPEPRWGIGCRVGRRRRDVY